MTKSKQCYAKGYGECEGTISEEHYISRCLLEEMNPVEIQVNGFPWLHGHTKPIPPARLFSNILCVKHNNELQTLDKFSCEFFKALKKFSSQPDIKEEFVCQTSELERWLIKVYLGLHVGKHLGEDGELLLLPSKNIEPYLLNNLIYGTALPSPLGLYLNIGLPAIPGASRDINISNQVSITAYMTNDDQTIFSLHCTMMGIITFNLIIREKSEDTSLLGNERPSEINIYNSKIKFEW